MTYLRSIPVFLKTDSGEWDRVKSVVSGRHGNSGRLSPQITIKRIQVVFRRENTTTGKSIKFQKKIEKVTEKNHSFELERKDREII